MGQVGTINRFLVFYGNISYASVSKCIVIGEESTVKNLPGIVMKNRILGIFIVDKEFCTALSDNIIEDKVSIFFMEDEIVPDE